MSLSASNYTPPGGGTVIGQQTAQNTPNATNSIPPPNSPSSAYGSWNSLNNQYISANANNVTANAPNTRQALVNNSNIPAEQNNYDDLARQLFQYDQGTLAPQFQGQNPGIPSDAASFGRVDASPLAMTVNSAGLPANQGLSTATSNPKYAYASQSSLADSLSTLLGVLNNSIRENMTDVKGKNASNISNAQAALDGVYKLMQLKQDAEDKAAARSSSGGLAEAKLNEAKDRLITDAQKGVTFPELIKRYTPDGLTPSEIRDAYNHVNYYKKPAGESEQDVLDLLNDNKPAGIKAKATAADQEKTAHFASGVADQIFTSWKKMSPQERAVSAVPGINKISAIVPNYSNMEALFYGDLLEGIRKSGIGGRITQYEISWMHDKLLPGPGDSLQTAQNKISALKQALQKKMQDPNYDITTSSSSGDTTVMTGPKGTFNVPNNKVKQFQQNGYK